MKRYRPGLLLLAAMVASTASTSHAQKPASLQISLDQSGAAPSALPIGELPDDARPLRYRLTLSILPDRSSFTGHAEIDVRLNRPLRALYMHGRALDIKRVVAISGGRQVPAHWQQLNPTGIGELTFDTTLGARDVTLKFDYDADFDNTGAGLYHAQADGKWYSWTFFESTNARSAFPSFDEPKFKTPFEIAILTAPGNSVVSNAREMATTPKDGLISHIFAATRPIPTYAVAFAVGLFARASMALAPNAVRPDPLAIGVVATQDQHGRLGFVGENTAPIVSLLERYFAASFPYPKLDQIASPEQPGGMENPGADIYNNAAILFDGNPSIVQQQHFGVLVSHELAHQWFGDLVTPEWWDDLWLNESFATRMGYLMGDQWRPDLDIAMTRLPGVYSAMDIDSLQVGRPIHQHIADSGEIDSAFDGITYAKGAQVITMIAGYMGEDRFRDAVRLYMQRYADGSANTDEFLAALKQTSGDPLLVAAMRSFIDQTGVPLITVTRHGATAEFRQSRYAFAGSTPDPAQWTVPLCVRIGPQRSCRLVDGPALSLSAGPDALIIPNAGGAGYYRFAMPDADWNALINALPSLPAAEALAVDDSLWASFWAGRTDPELLFVEAGKLVDNPDPVARIAAGDRLADLHQRGLVAEGSQRDYQRLIGAIYRPSLASLGFNPAAGAYRDEAATRQLLRQGVVRLLTAEALDPEIDSKLEHAAADFIDGKAQALDKGYLTIAVETYVRQGGIPAAQSAMNHFLAQSSPDAARAELAGIAGVDRADVGHWLVADQDPRIRLSQRIAMVTELAHHAATRDIASEWVSSHYEDLAKNSSGIAVIQDLPSLFEQQCSSLEADRLRALGPRIRAVGNGGVLNFQRVVERIEHCRVLKDRVGDKMAAALAKSKPR